MLGASVPAVVMELIVEHVTLMLQEPVAIWAEIVVGYPRRLEPRWNLIWTNQVVSRSVSRVF